jgi:tetratricopeptide (TPR) repeat protein
VPAWVNEGLAEYYETFDSKDNGRIAIIGAPSAQHVQELQTTIMPLGELMAVDHSSKIYNEGDRRGIFYAESWALVHYLLGNPKRAGQLSAYLDRLSRGDAPATAFATAFKTDERTLQDELQDYLRRVSFPAVQFTFDSKTAPGSVRTSTVLSEDDAQAYLAELLVATHRDDEGRALAQTVVSRNPSSARALSVLGSLELSAGRLPGALPYLERSAALAPADGWILSLYGRGLIAQANALDGGEARMAAYGKARSVMVQAATLPPASATTLYLLGLSEIEPGADPAQAIAPLREAVRLAPARQYYALSLAEAFVQTRDYDGATSVLGPLLAAGNTDQVREDARRALGRVAQLRALTEARRAPSAAGESTPLPSAEPPSDRAGTGRASGPGESLVLRRVQAGETRVIGILQAIECQPKAALIVVTVDGHVTRYASGTLAAIDFISYLPNPPKSVTCGPFQPVQQALITFRSNTPETMAANAAGEVVAVEIVPDGYLPPEH